MSDNPYSAPQKCSVSENRFEQLDQVYESLYVPAIALITASAVWLFFLAITFAINLILFAAPAGGFFGEADVVTPDTVVLILQCGWYVVLTSCNIVILIGGWRMRTLRSYGLCQLSAILAIIPCTGPCYLLGIPFGIWALIVLNRPGVREVFEP